MFVNQRSRSPSVTYGDMLHKKRYAFFRKKPKVSFAPRREPRNDCATVYGSGAPCGTGTLRCGTEGLVA